MTRDEYLETSFKESAKGSRELWDTVRSRVSEEYMARDETASVLDILQNTDGTVSLVMVRSDGNSDLDQVELWHFSADNKLFKKPKIDLSFTGGPFLNVFLEGKASAKNT
jgi:hypothetical protein